VALVYAVTYNVLITSTKYSKRLSVMQITDLAAQEKILPFLRLGFRPFFLGGAIFGAVAIIVWLLIYRGVLQFSPLGGGYWWHIHEMVFGFGAAIIAGFLLTAVQNWTGMRGVQGNTLLMLFSVWLVARLLLIFPHWLGAELTSIIDLIFLPLTAFILGKPILAIKQYRNLFFVPLLILFTLVNAQMHAAIYFPKIFSLTFGGYTGVFLVTFLMSVMIGRVVPMFTANGTQTPKASPLPWLDKAANGTIGLAMLLLLVQPFLGFSATFFGSILIVAGILQTMRWIRWKPWITLNVPLLWSLHIAIKFLAFGLVVLGLSYISDQIPTNHAWHLLTVGAIGGIILAMISRVSLGHTGRRLSPPTIIVIAYLLINLAALIRFFGPWLIPEKNMMFIDISGTFWALAFLLFALSYGPMLLKARKDGRPG
jgi:uncharacterized protein involved in response to NO